MKPRLIHLIKVELLRRSHKNGWDDVFNEAVGELLFCDPIETNCQISYSVKERAMAEGLGNSPQASGYCLFYKEEWAKGGGKIGDRLQLSGDCLCVIVEIRPSGHYRGNYCFEKVFFDRVRGS